MDYSINVHVHDPHASPNEMAHEYKLTLTEKISDGYDAIVIAVGHQQYKDMGPQDLLDITSGEPVIMDLKGLFNRKSFGDDVTYWRL
jgi:UDP-N-acetyl-D-galactosamine dehydrogenase